jgi:hypothetical protein
MRFLRHGPVVQRPSIRPCQGRDRRFESGRDRHFEQAAASNSAVVARGRTLTILRSRVRMISNMDQTIRRRRSGEAVARALGMSCAMRVSSRLSSDALCRLTDGARA